MLNMSLDNTAAQSLIHSVCTICRSNHGIIINQCTALARKGWGCADEWARAWPCGDWGATLVSGRRNAPARAFLHKEYMPPIALRSAVA